LRAYIVVDLGFGDSGKGLLTDFLVRHLDVDLIVRYNGGAQAGHNVVQSDGRHHTFSQFGSGMLNPRVKTFLSRHVVIHPGALLLEGEALVKKGVSDAFSRLRLSDRSLIITPFHQAANRIREIVRGTDRHGSCGVGVGEVVEDAQSRPEDTIIAKDLADQTSLRRKLRIVQERKREQILHLLDNVPGTNRLARELEIFNNGNVIDAWILSARRVFELGLITPDTVLQNWLNKAETVVFEGAQGVLLDADVGFHPFTTWSRSTTRNALELISEMQPKCDVRTIGVIRSYAVRHGPGPLPTETNTLSPTVDEHNATNEWQGQVRYGWFDAVLTRYALSVTEEIDTLMVTHMDVLESLKAWAYCRAYEKPGKLDDLGINFEISGDMVTNFRLPAFLSLEQREMFTRALSHITAITESCEPNEGKVIQKIETLLGKSVGVISRGPKAEDVQAFSSIKL